MLKSRSHVSFVGVIVIMRRGRRERKIANTCTKLRCTRHREMK